MPTEIFLSYRRSDATGNARFLHDQLLLRFDSSRVFFDLHTLGAGEVFPDEIHNALRECSVLLALIGPGWVGAERDGKLRLHDPLDFVRREIALALELGKQVIPVLLESAAEPAAADLPPCLASLALRQAHTQRGSPAEYASSLERLIDRVSQLPGVSPPSALRRATGVRIAAHQLPLLCDRSGQNDAARDALRTELQAAQPRPMVLVLHGRVDEEHHAFVERLERFSLPRFLKGTPFAAGLRVVRIHEPLRVDGAQADFDLRLRERLGEALDIGFVADDATLLRHAQQQKITALLAVLTWRASDFAGDPGLAIERVFGYWSQLPAPGPRLLAGCIVCLKYDRDLAPRGWIQRVFGAADDRVKALRAAVDDSVTAHAGDARVAWCVAAELPSVTVADLSRWVDEVAQHIGHFRVPQDRIHAIIGGRMRPMQPVLLELEKLVPAD